MRSAIVLSILAAAGLGAAEPAAQPDAYTERIRALESEIRGLIDEQATAAGPAAAAANTDYAAARARASEDVRRRLQIVEYHLADNDYTRAVEGCNAILRDHPHEPATVRLKYRILMAMVERERALLERERQYRAEEGLADAQQRGILPKDGPKIPRTVWVFPEDIEESDRVAVKAKLQQKITLNYEGATVGEVLKPLFAIAGINFVILDRALSNETLTIHLVDDTVENALSTIAKLVEVRYNYSANTVYIGAADSEVMKSEIIRLSSGLTDVVTEPQLPPTIGGDSGGGGGGGGNQAPPPQAQGQGQGGQGGQANSDLERFLEKVPDVVAGWPAEGKLYLDRKSNTLYVHATPNAISELKRLLGALDYNSAQILIEARFVEVSEDAARSLGVEWGGSGSNGKITAGAPLTGGVKIPARGLTFSEVGTIAPATVGSTGLNLGLLFSPTGLLGIRAAISALESENKAESLAEPRILTLNNAVGQIQLLETLSFIENYETQGYSTGGTVTGNNTTITNNNVVATPKWKTVQTGYTLRIRPSIARNSDIITLDLRPSVTQPTGSVVEDTFTYQPAAGQDAITKPIRRPEFSTRSLATSLHVQNGQTVVLGGLTTDVVSSGDSGVPGLRRIPMVGRLFGSKKNSLNRSNLLIFVTAHIIDPSGAKIGEDIRRLRDTSAVVMPEEIRLAEAELRAVEAQRAADAEAKTKEATERKPSTPPTNRADQRRR